MAGRLGGGSDPAWLARLEQGFVDAIAAARAAAVSGAAAVGIGDRAGYRENRRHAGGPVDRALPVLRLDRLRRQRAGGAGLLCLPSRGAGRRQPAVDRRLSPFPPRRTGGRAARGRRDLCHRLRRRRQHGPLRRCLADAGASSERTFAARRTARPRIGAAALAAAESPCSDGHRLRPIARSTSRSNVARPSPSELSRRLRRRAGGRRTGAPGCCDHWVRWAETWADVPAPDRWTAAGLRLRLGRRADRRAARARSSPKPACRSALPLAKSRRLSSPMPMACPATSRRPANIPYGGYEVEEAHRFYGLPGAFAPGAPRPPQRRSRLPRAGRTGGRRTSAHPSLLRPRA